MSAPLRIQRKRIAGSKMPANTVCVTRNGLWSNPFIIGEPSGVFPVGMGMHGKAETLIASMTREQCVSFYCDMVGGHLCPEMYPHGHLWMDRFHKRCKGHAADVARIMLRGCNLACWCHLCAKHDAAGGKPLHEHCRNCVRCHVDPLGQIANDYPVTDSSVSQPALAVVETKNAEAIT